MDEYNVLMIHLQHMINDSKGTMFLDNQTGLNPGTKWEVTEVIHQLDEMPQHAELYGVSRVCRDDVGLVK